MSSVTLQNSPTDQSTGFSSVVFAGAIVLMIATACLIAGWAPLGFSIATVFLFAGPHNWMEARYFLSKMPARWGKLWLYFTIGLGGVALLTVAQIVMTTTLRYYHASGQAWTIGYAVWNTLFITWITSLVLMRSRQNPKRLHWEFPVPVGLLLIAATWLWPLAWSLGLVYLHPLVALLFLDRELGKQNRDWQIVYRRCLWLVPVSLCVLWWQLAAKPKLPGNDLLSMQITHHAGAGILSGSSTHLLVSTHTFLEMLHYAVWVIAVPLVAMKTVPWNLTKVPLANKSAPWRTMIAVIIGAGVLVMLALWAGFLVNYPVTRDLYFTLALAHVLAEVPFLLRLL
ncbi:MAG: hypothetical protein ACKVH8_03510 [Pirellulales bacterium]